ncbi:MULTISPECIES: hypothetical protein [Amycolatopsis]|uniref:hypothetical protein n=1 Tax=Amycolatopsis TaxID=1813 RepID=UPI0007E1157A|nr:MULTISPECIES: hypothetical protein [Amycolatopsis]OAP25320.1 Flavin-dependent monooxygenase, oxygenase subunit HsaA [Amycolatopsis sp. M39]
MRLASLDGSTGWVAGIVGVHPWEMALCDRRVQEEIWGADNDTWIASPYAPMGVLKPVDGGYAVTGRWQFSSGTDHCDWIFLGDADGNVVQPPRNYPVLLPRAVDEIVEDTWVVVVKDAFVPDYRAVPFTTIFPLGITSAVIGIAEGALAAHLACQRTRVHITGTRVKDDPYVLYAISAAAEEIKASRTALLDNVSRFYDKAAAGSARRPGRVAPHAGRRGVAGRGGRPQRRQRPADGQPGSSGSGATATGAWRTRSTCPLRCSTRPRRPTSTSSLRPARCSP